MSTELARQNNSLPQVFNFFDPVQFETMQRVSKLFSNSELVPDMYKVSPTNPEARATANCMIAIEMSQRIGASPLMIMQNMVIIYGRPSWSSKFLVATVNTCGRFEPLKYKIENLGKVGKKVKYTDYVWNDQAKKKLPVTKEFDGTNVDNLQCTAWTTARGSDEVLESSPITIEMAIQEGWYTKSGSKWTTMTKQMLMYRAASFWTSAYAPELSMGMKTTEEYEDIRDVIDIPHEDMTVKIEEEIKAQANQETLTMPADPEPQQQQNTTPPPPPPATPVNPGRTPSF